MKKETFEMKPEAIAQMVVNSHENHYAMIIPADAMYVLAKALLAANSQLAKYAPAISDVDRIYKEAIFPDDIIRGLSDWQDRHEEARRTAAGILAAGGNVQKHLSEQN